MPNPIDNPELYESMVLGGKSSPGTVTFSGHDEEIGWDVKKAAGQKGASMDRTSEDPIRFKAAFYLAEDDLDGWPDFEAVIRSTVSGPTPKALDAYHPDLAERGIKSVVLAKFYGVVHDGMGGQTRNVEFLQYLPPAKKGGSPKGSSANAAGGPRPTRVPDPNQAALDELARLTDEYNRTPWG